MGWAAAASVSGERVRRAGYTPGERAMGPLHGAQDWPEAGRTTGHCDYDQWKCDKSCNFDFFLKKQRPSSLLHSAF